MEYRNIFQLIAGIFRRTGVTPVIVGGFAFNFEQVSGQPPDINLLMTEEGFVKCLPCFEEAGCRLFRKENLFAKLGSEQFSLKDINIILISIPTLEKIIQKASRVEKYEVNFYVPVFSMDEYADFVEFYVENLLDLKSYEKERAEEKITVPFVLK